MQGCRKVLSCGGCRGHIDMWSVHTSVTLIVMLTGADSIRPSFKKNSKEA